MIEWFLGQLQMIKEVGYLNCFVTMLIILVLESLLSVDNAAVVATQVSKSGLSQDEQDKALKYGILGAFFFRGVGLLLAGFLIANPSIGGIMKILGGLYLIHLFYTSFTPEKDSTEEGDVKWIQTFLRFIGLCSVSLFWKVVFQVEITDFVFSIDNIFACVAMSKIMLIIILSVFIGIVTMRFVTQKFVSLMNQYPSLEKSAFIVIGLLGLKLTIGGLCDLVPSLDLIKNILENHYFDFGFSSLTMIIFFYPIMIKKN